MNPTLFSRRLFLNRGVQLLSAAATLPVFLDRSAHCLAADYAANPQGAGRPDDKVLVILQLAGGNDGLNTVIPIGNDDYHRARPKIGVARNAAMKLNDEWGLHPAAQGFKKLWDAGDLAIVHAVGYPNPNRSHFRSTDIWTTGVPDKVGTSGWVGRYCDACCAGADPSHDAGKSTAKNDKQPDPATAIALELEPPAALTGEHYIPLTFRAPQALAYRGGRGANNGAFEKLNGGDPAARGASDEMMQGSSHGAATGDFLERSALNARIY